MTADREFRHRRLIAASPVEIFRAIADPARLARWWGPDGFSSTFEVFEFVPGGSWRFTLHGPDGKNYPNLNRFVEIAMPERVVIEHLDASHHFILTITLAARSEGTEVGWHQLFDSKEHRDEIAIFVESANEENLARLAEEVGGEGLD